MASTYRRGYPPATGPALVHSVQGGVILWIRGQGMRTGGRSVPPDGIHLPPGELSTRQGGG